MQYKNAEYNEKEHDRFNALTVKQPYAKALVSPAYDKGHYRYAMKSIEVRGFNTTYRGDVLICSSASPEVPDELCGYTLGFVELYDTKPVHEFTEEDWANTQIPESERPSKGYGWLMRNPRRVVEMPVKGQLGIFKLVYTKDDITEYPTTLRIGQEGMELIKKQIEEYGKRKKVQGRR